MPLGYGVGRGRERKQGRREITEVSREESEEDKWEEKVDKETGQVFEGGWRKMCSRESLGISQQPAPGPWGLLPISASSQGTRVSSSLSLDSSEASVTWDDCSEEVWLFY